MVKNNTEANQNIPSSNKPRQYKKLSPNYTEKDLNSEYAYKSTEELEKWKDDMDKRRKTMPGVAQTEMDKTYAKVKKEIAVRNQLGYDRTKPLKNRNKSQTEVYQYADETEVSSGKQYTIDDIKKLNGCSVYVVNDGQEESGRNVKVKIDNNLAEVIMATSNEFEIDPTLIIAVMAHESGFDPNASSGRASGIMQVHNDFFIANSTPNKDLIISLGGDYKDINDEAANVVAWGNSYDFWVQQYGQTDESLMALRQGFREDGWSIGAQDNAKEFLDIKDQLDKMIY